MGRYRNTTLLLAAASDALADVQLTVGERGEAVASNCAFRELIAETDAGGPALNQLRAWLCVTPEAAAAFDLLGRGAAARKAGRVEIRRVEPDGRGLWFDLAAFPLPAFPARVTWPDPPATA